MRRLLTLATSSVLALAVLTPAAAAPDPAGDVPTPPDWLVVDGGLVQPQFALSEAIEETLWVQTTVDSDRDGVDDRVRIRLSRPAETETAGIKVPVVFEHSPYRSNIGGGANHDVDFAVMPQEGIQPRRQLSAALADPSATPISKADLPGGLDNYWVPRGYAVVLGESIGTGFSDGCSTVGDEMETLGTQAVIDWLNGRAEARDGDGNVVEADWTTGDVGMTGVSYNGTLPNQVATTGVEGLRTIVPVAAIANWYDYYRANGLVVAPHSRRSGVGSNAYLGEDLDVLADFVNGPTRVDECRPIVEEMLANQDRVTGDYNDYWDARNYLDDADQVEASVFVVHGLEDYNVMPTAYSTWWDELGKAGVERKIWLHNGGHGGPSGNSGYQDELNKWMGHWLFGVDNGITDEPAADVQRRDGTYEQYADWPVPGSQDTVLHLGADDATAPGTLDLQRAPGAPAPTQSFVDDGRNRNTDASLIQAPDQPDANRLAYLSPPLGEDAHLSGTPSVRLRASVDNRYAANLTAVLVDYGPAGSTAAPVMVTRGWTDVQNRSAIDRSKPIEQGRDYFFEWELEPDDHVFAAGHRIGLVVVSTDQQYTVRPDPGTQLTVDPSLSRVTLPLVGGSDGLVLTDEASTAG
ncbi:Xaa-Pro dipeptidyl-peptidase [Salsipaludibacter albus]|uniref:Xaa-Pro dipeptidyl-peptidase n=1 Tax=Salsipaludibacter albus TaxID=2849650 RepID=UPI001EE43FFB|nr:Xaa-Pro dipeptidyl-peptidase [Salsipaludibacter albus]